MEKWTHKKYATSIRIPEWLDTMELRDKIKQAESCMAHEMSYCFEKSYRRYRRGKNRCKWCGIKTKGAS